MTKRALSGLAAMVVELAGVPEAEQLDVLAAVIRAWLEREREPGYRRLWARASAPGGSRAAASR